MCSSATFRQKVKQCIGISIKLFFWTFIYRGKFSESFLVASGLKVPHCFFFHFCFWDFSFLSFIGIRTQPIQKGSPFFLSFWVSLLPVLGVHIVYAICSSKTSSKRMSRFRKSSFLWVWNCEAFCAIILLKKELHILHSYPFVVSNRWKGKGSWGQE